MIGECSKIPSTARFSRPMLGKMWTSSQLWIKKARSLSRAFFITAPPSAHRSTRTNRGASEHARVTTAAVGFMIRS
jgi:hypothetical protein